MTEREKIADVLNSVEISAELTKSDIYKLVDELIAKGYGNIDKTVEEAYVFTLELNDKIKAAEHRAEVAERAFDNIIEVFHDVLSAMFPDTKIDLDEWKKNNLANAEKELAEEG